ncbi:hypothetical protein RI367_007798 [Sorochytrium milnesiophthora]
MTARKDSLQFAYHRLESVAQAQWLHHISPYLLTNVHFATAAQDGHISVLRWLHEHRPDMDCPPLALEWALQAGQTEVAAFLTLHHPTILSELYDMVTSTFLPAAAASGDMAALDWFLDHLPAAFAADNIPFDNSCHHASWALDPQIPLSDMYAHFESRALFARPDQPLCTRSLYDKLTPRRPRQVGAGYYFAQSAIAANDIEWLRQVSSDFDTPISRYCDTGMLYETRQLSLLQQLCDAGHLTIPSNAVHRFLAHENLVGAH